MQNSAFLRSRAGLLVGLALLLLALGAGGAVVAQTSKTLAVANQPTQWVSQVGAGLVGPACASGTNSVTCTPDGSGTAQITLNVNSPRATWIGNSGDPSFLNAFSHGCLDSSVPSSPVSNSTSMYIMSSPTTYLYPSNPAMWSANNPCISSHTFTGLAPNTTYYFRIEDHECPEVGCGYGVPPADIYYDPTPFTTPTSCTPPTVTCSVSPTTGPTGVSATWTAIPSGGTGTYTYSWTGDDGLSVTDSASPTVSHTYNSSGTFGAHVTVKSVGLSSASTLCTNSIAVAAPPSVTLTANPDTIDSGQSSKLFWSTSGGTATSCNALSTPDFAGGATTNPAGGASTGTLTTTSNFQIQCTGPGGNSPISTATVTVLHPQAVITSSPGLLPKGGGNTTISFDSSGGTGSCSVTGPGVNIAATTTGSKTVPVTSQSTFTIDCQSTTSGPDIISKVIVNVASDFTEF